MTKDEAITHVTAHLVAHVQTCEMEETTGFSEIEVSPADAAQLRAAQGIVVDLLRNLGRFSAVAP